MEPLTCARDACVRGRHPARCAIAPVRTPEPARKPGGARVRTALHRHGRARCRDSYGGPGVPLGARAMGRRAEAGSSGADWDITAQYERRSRASARARTSHGDASEPDDAVHAVAAPNGECFTRITVRGSGIAAAPSVARVVLWWFSRSTRSASQAPRTRGGLRSIRAASGLRRRPPVATFNPAAADRPPGSLASVPWPLEWWPRG